MPVVTLTADQLRKTYDPDELNLAAGISTPKAIIGQERAQRALEFGLGNRALGFNIFVSGEPGAEKIEAISHFLGKLAEKDPTPPDWCYVNNFTDPYFPKCLRLPTGKAAEFRDDLYQFVEAAKKALIKAFESEEYGQKRDELGQKFDQKQMAIFKELDQEARKENFLIKRTPVEIFVIPRAGDQPMTDEQFAALPPEDRERILHIQRELKDRIKTTVRKSYEVDKEFNQLLAELEQKVAHFAIEALLDDLAEKYASDPGVPEYLDDVKTDILKNLGEFLQTQKEENMPGKNHIHKRYEVNAVVDNAHLSGAPIIIELNPTYNNLFGKIERESAMGMLITNFTLIRAGSLHMANGGYLVLPVEDVLRNYFSWESLKRALRNRIIEIEDPGEQLGFLSTKSLKPEPIPLDIQVILIGRPHWFYLLHELDDDFQELFKVKAEFDTSMPVTQENLNDFIGFVNHLCQAEQLLPTDKKAMVRIMEYAHRLAGQKDRISNQFGEIGDLVREAHYYARKEGLTQISGKQVMQAIREKRFRSNLLQEKINELIRNEAIFIDLEGSKVGQVNGLSVIDLGDIAFGRPSRITATVSVGKGGVIDIEHEANLGGSIHTKGVLILSGFLFQQFGADKPVSLAIQLAFEQSYGGVEGDSASSAELYAILSALSDLPVRQGIAVTGSVNQRGEIQSVGGINEKIEGFFEICRQRGLTGEQGVIIPATNVMNLMLDEEVVAAVDEGRFHIWAISTIDEGIEILTGMKAGATQPDERTGEIFYEADSVYGKADQFIRDIDKRLRQLDKDRGGRRLYKKFDIPRRHPRLRW